MPRPVDADEPAMAYDVSKRPGEWVSGQARRYERRLFIALVAVCVGAGLVIYLALGPRNVWLTVPTLAAMLIVRKAFISFEDRATRSRKGATAEVGIGDLLNELRGHQFHVMHDLDQFGFGNVDHVVSGPTGVFMIETKFRRYQVSDLPKARRRAKQLHDRLGVWVTPVICIYQRAGRNCFNHKGVWVVPRGALLDWLRSQKNTVLPFERLARFADTL